MPACTKARKLEGTVEPVKIGESHGGDQWFLARRHFCLVESTLLRVLRLLDLLRKNLLGGPRCDASPTSSRYGNWLGCPPRDHVCQETDRFHISHVESIAQFLIFRIHPLVDVLSDVGTTSSAHRTPARRFAALGATCGALPLILLRESWPATGRPSPSTESLPPQDLVLLECELVSLKRSPATNGRASLEPSTTLSPLEPSERRWLQPTASSFDE